MDLTGGLAEHWSLGDIGSEEGQRPEEDSDQLRRRRLELNLLRPVKDQCAISCSSYSSPVGQGKNVVFILEIRALLISYHIV